MENIATPVISQSTFHFYRINPLLLCLSVPLFLYEICLSVKSEDPIMNHGIIILFIIIMLIIVLRVCVPFVNINRNIIMYPLIN